MPLLLSSAYLPPISFFTAMLESGGEVFIEQFDSYHKQTFRNRALIATSSGVQSLTIPVVKSEGGKMLMKDVRISDHGEWRHLHWNALETAYMNSPFFIYYQDDLRPFYEKRYEFLLDFNMELTQTIADLIGMKCRFKRTDEFVAEPVEGMRTPLLNILELQQQIGQAGQENIRPMVEQCSLSQFPKNTRYQIPDLKC